MNMKKFMRMTVLIASLLLALASLPVEADQQSPPQKSRLVWLRLKAGPILSGNLIKLDSDSVDFTVKGVLQTVSCEDLIGVMFIPPSVQQATIIQNHSPPSESAPAVYAMSNSLRPTILYREPAPYTPKAKAEKVEGTIILQVVFHETGQITNVIVIRGLPHGLSDQAINAAHSVRFIPAMKDGRPVSVRGTLEYTFNLY